jgi:hypothetical protein
MAKRIVEEIVFILLTMRGVRQPREGEDRRTTFGV